MKIAIRANELSKEELLTQGLNHSPELEWVDSFDRSKDADAYIDLLFEENNLSSQSSVLISKPVLVNAVSTTGRKLPENYIRINAWPTFLKRQVTEASSIDLSFRAKAEEVMKCFSKKIEWTPDQPGFISARVISMIINEAYFALQEKVSSRDEIDIAMKLGTNYPYGPFEWSRAIGLRSIHQLLSTLSETNNRYHPAELMSRELSHS